MSAFSQRSRVIASAGWVLLKEEGKGVNVSVRRHACMSTSWHARSVFEMAGMESLQHSIILSSGYAAYVSAI